MVYVALAVLGTKLISDLAEVQQSLNDLEVEKFRLWRLFLVRLHVAFIIRHRLAERVETPCDPRRKTI